MELNNNTVLITGGGSGIGLALAKALAAFGNKIIVCGRDPAKLATMQQENPVIESIQCDITRDGDQQKLIEHIQLKYPKLNILINNAGIQYNYDFLDLQPHTQLIETEITTNFLAQIKLTDRLLPMFSRQPCSAIVNITSALAIVPKQSAPIYSATKAAMHIFTKALRYQLEQSPIKVFEIIPALVDTAMTEGRGKGKISTELLATKALRAIKADRYEIRIAKTKLLFILHRMFPSLAERIIRYG